MQGKNFQYNCKIFKSKTGSNSTLAFIFLPQENSFAPEQKTINILEVEIQKTFLPWNNIRLFAWNNIRLFSDEFLVIFWVAFRQAFRRMALQQKQTPYWSKEKIAKAE